VDHYSGPGAGRVAAGVSIVTLAARRGYMLAKPFGLLLVTYSFWLLVSLNILPNSLVGIGIAFIVVVILGQWIYRRDRATDITIQSWWNEHRRLILAYELFFTLAFIGWAIFRAYSPDISSAEKPMEMAFFNAASRSASFRHTIRGCPAIRSRTITLAM